MLTKKLSDCRPVRLSIYHGLAIWSLNRIHYHYLVCLVLLVCFDLKFFSVALNDLFCILSNCYFFIEQMKCIPQLILLKLFSASTTHTRTSVECFLTSTQNAIIMNTGNLLVLSVKYFCMKQKVLLFVFLT